MLKLFTELPLEEIAKLEKLAGQELNEAKKILAEEATALCRGAGAAKAASETARKTFEEGGFGKALPSYTVRLSSLGGQTANTFVLAATSEFPSKKEVKRRIEQGNIYINEKQITDPFAKDYVTGENRVKVGKKTHFKIIIE